MVSAEQWRASIGLWGTAVKQDGIGKNPESLKQKYFSQTNNRHSTRFTDVNNCPKLMRFKSLSMVGQMIVFFCLAVFQWTPNIYCSIHRNKQQVFMGSKQFSNQVTFYVEKFAHPCLTGSRITLKENNVFATTQYTAATGQAVVISLRQTNLNENSELSSKRESLLAQDL